MVEEAANSAEAGRASRFDRYVHATKMQPQSSGSLRSNAGAEKGKEIAAKLNIHRVHGQLRGLDTTGRILQQIFCRRRHFSPLNIATIAVFREKEKGICVQVEPVVFDSRSLTFEAEQKAGSSREVRGVAPVRHPPVPPWCLLHIVPHTSVSVLSTPLC